MCCCRLFLADSGYADCERWLQAQGDDALWISCVRRGQLTAQRAQTITREFEAFRQARQWLDTQHELPLRSGDALHLALARRYGLILVSADRILARCAQHLGLPIQFIG